MSTGNIKPNINSNDVSRHGMWRSKKAFIMAATGSAIGLGNIWKFPYIAGENGGSAFLIVYVASVLLLGLPLLISEFILGREGRTSPITTMQRLVKIGQTHPVWVMIGWNGAIAGLLIFGYYNVVAGWTLKYAVEYSAQTLGLIPTLVSPEAATTHWQDFLADPWQLIAFQTAFLIIAIFIIARGVNKGLEWASLRMIPLLFVLLLVLLVYSMVEGEFLKSVEYMFSPKWEMLRAEGVLTALGHAFFTLALGTGTMMTYGAYLPANVSIPSTAITIALLDTLAAIIAGLAIFAIVFSNPELEADNGAQLLFVTLTSAFSTMPGGTLFGAVFFILLSMAALTSLISLSEPALAWAVEQYNANRTRVAITIGVGTWVAGLGTVFSFNLWEDWHLVGELNYFELTDYITSNILLPVGGFFIALFTGWVLPQKILAKQMPMSPGMLKLALITTRFIAPSGVAVILLYTLLH